MVGSTINFAFQKKKGGGVPSSKSKMCYFYLCQQNFLIKGNQLLDLPLHKHHLPYLGTQKSPQEFRQSRGNKISREFKNFIIILSGWDSCYCEFYNLDLQIQFQSGWDHSPVRSIDSALVWLESLTSQIYIFSFGLGGIPHQLDRQILYYYHIKHTPSHDVHYKRDLL